MAAKFLDYTPENVALLCPICLEKYNDPRSLICSHTFCQDCINQHVLKQKENGNLMEGIECPLCRVITPKSAKELKPEEWSKSLPVNYALQEVITSVRTDIDLCRICQSKNVRSVATKFCFQCNNRFCDACEKNIFEHFQDHTIVRIEDSAGLGKLLDELDYCAVHDKRIEFYCIDESELCCSSCAISKHRKCNKLAEISDIAGKQNKEKEVTMVKKIKELKTKVNNVDYFYDNQRREIDHQFGQIYEEVSKEHTKILEMLKESRSKILDEANDMRKGANDQYKLYKDQCRSLTSSLESAYQNIAIIRKHGTPVQQFIALQKQERQFEDNLGKGYELFNNLKYFDISSEGPFILPYLDKSKQKQCQLKSKYIKVTSEEIPDRKVMKLENVLSVDIKAADGDAFEPLYTGLEFLADGRLIAVDNRNNKCLVLNERLETVGLFSSNLCLLDVISMSEEELLVFGGDKFHLFSITEKNVMKLNKTIDIERNRTVFSASCYKDDMFVVATFDSEKPAVLMNKNGAVKDFDIKFPEKKWKIGNHRCTFNVESGALAITDSVENKVYIYDTDTKHETVIQDERIKCPKGITSGPASCFFVCSRKTNAIVQISCEGDFLHSHRMKDMSLPYVLCFSKDNTKLVVTNNSSPRKLQLYRIIR